MTDDQVLAWLHEEVTKPLVGWDFSYVRERRHTGTKPWDLETIVVEHLTAATAVLDVDTGDGHRFAEYLGKSQFQGKTAASEGYLPNVPIARTTLGPIGVDVREAKATSLPWPDGSFDLVLNRHGLLDAAETRRVLKPDGWLITQQVGSQTNLDIHRALGAPLPAGPTWDLATARAALEADGFQIRQAEEAFPITRYDDVGALVWVLKAVPWQIPDFTVDRYAERLLALHRQMERSGQPFDVGFHVFLLVAQRHRDQRAFEIDAANRRTPTRGRQLQTMDSLDLDRPDLSADAWR
jgi:SAM-dependent methyltransferase